jgi:hypothetical protein
MDMIGPKEIGRALLNIWSDLGAEPVWLISRWEFTKVGRRPSISPVIGSQLLGGRYPWQGTRGFSRSGFSAFVPKGLEDSAWGFNPRNPSMQRPALQGRKIFVIDALFAQAVQLEAPVLPPPSGRGSFIIGPWG